MLSLRKYCPNKSLVSLLICVSCFFVSIQVFAQNPRLHFISRGVAIGEDVKVSLSFDHPYQLDMFFPNSPELFAPFELKNTAFFQTFTKDTISTDSMIFTLRVFEINKIQKLSLPVSLVLNKDSLTYWSNMDSVILQEFIPDSILKDAEIGSSSGFLQQSENQKLSIPVKIVMGSFLLLCLVALAFRNKIKIFIDYLRFQKKQRDFVTKFKKMMRAEESLELLQNVINSWREQMTILERKPFDTLSSVEIEKESGQNAGQALREIESSLFGSQKSDRIPIALQILFDKVRETHKAKKSEFRKQLKNTK
jgi:hypothetical protein